jgi:hypothetical protein
MRFADTWITALYLGRYAMWEVLHEGSPPTIVWQSHKWGKEHCVMFKDGQAYVGPLAAYREELDKPFTW